MKNKKSISFYRPVIQEDDVRGVTETLRSGWITTGPKTKEFEKIFASYVKAPDALALSSCTAGLHLALLCHDIGKGDIVITTPITFCSGVRVIEEAGALPLLVDVEPGTLNIDPAKIEEAILKNRARRKQIKAILIVHFAGHVCRMKEITRIAKKYKLKIIEDAAHGIPTKYKNRIVGSFGNLTAFSFYATKNLTTGEGGMLTGPAKLVQKARLMSLHGMSRDAWKRYAVGGSWHYDVCVAGFKYNMTDIQASLGMSQLKKLSRFQKRREKIAAAYDKAFSKISSLQIPSDEKYGKHAWHLYVLRLQPERLNISRDRFIQELTARGIGTSVHFIPIHLHSYFKNKYGFKNNDFPTAYGEYLRMISLPLYPAMSGEDVSRVIASVSEIVREHQK